MTLLILFLKAIHTANMLMICQSKEEAPVWHQQPWPKCKLRVTGLKMSAAV